MIKLMKCFVAALFLCGIFLGAPLFGEEPGTFEDASPKNMPSILALDAKLSPSDDEFVVYYLRKDHKYDGWALWIWAADGGDAQAAFDHTQNWSEQDGIGYMRLKLDGSSTGGVKISDKAGGLGFIIRKKTSWTKDGKEDRMWNINMSHKVAVFGGDGNTYAAIPYKPSFVKAEFLTEKKVGVTLSGKYALDTDGGASGFVVKGSKEYSITKVYNTASPKDLSQNFTKNITIELGEAADIADKISINNDKFLSGTTILNTKLVVAVADKMTPPVNESLGCIFKDGNATFKLWAPTSSDAKVNIYADATGAAESSTDMTFDKSTGIWNVSMQVQDGKFYDYTLTNAKGTINVLDPYALSMAVNKGDGNIGRAAVIDMASSKAGVVDTHYPRITKREDAIIYEVSVRDFTISPDSGVSAEKGTYKAFIEKIPYLKELGITHVQLMPVLNFFYNDETNKAYENSGTVGGNNYNWGYDPHNYFTPEGWYSSDPADPYCRIRELRELIAECHKARLGVLLDVVYNHMATTKFLDDIVPGYYFRMTDKGGFKGNSGCGNDTASDHKMMKKLITDSLVHWVQDYGVDGFRFDLMGLMEASSVQDSYWACTRINRSVLFEGEGWKMYSGDAPTVGMDQNYMTRTNNVAVFNDEFRDIVKAGGMNETGKGLLTKKAADPDKLFNNMMGRPTGNYKADQPGDNLDYLVCHDGLTLHDAIVNNAELKEDADKAEIISRLKLGNFIVLTSQGIAFLHGGQERGRTKPNVKGEKNECVGNFVRNSYDASDNINQFVWALDDDYAGLLEYTKSLIAFRKSVAAFHIGDAKKVAKSAKKIDTKDDSGLVHAYSLKAGKAKYYIVINAKSESATVNIGGKTAGAVVCCDQNGASVDGVANPVGVSIDGKSVTLDPLTAVIIQGK